jgi:hypothetical protein
MTPEPEKPKNDDRIESVEDLRKLLDSAGFSEIPAFELHDMIQHPESFADDIERIRESITKRLEDDKRTEEQGNGR